MKVCELYVYYSFRGQIATQSKDVPDGTRIKLRVVGDNFDICRGLYLPTKEHSP